MSAIAIENYIPVASYDKNSGHDEDSSVESHTAPLGSARNVLSSDISLAAVAVISSHAVGMENFLDLPALHTGREIALPPPKSYTWNEEKDSLLREGVRINSTPDNPNWIQVANYINEAMKGRDLLQVNNKQCCDRWIYHADPELRNLKSKDEAWTDEEISKIYEIAEASSSSGKTRGNKTLINWKSAQDVLHRKAVDCRHKWQSLQNAKLKKGPFEKEEDDIIRAMVHEWGGKNGMWVAIGEKLGRPSRYCEARWTLTLSTRESRANIRGGLDKIGATNISADGVIDFRWNDFKDKFLLAGVEQHSTPDSPNWMQVAAYINSFLRPGEAVTNEQCRQRWKNHVNPTLRALKSKDDPWSEEEIDRLYDAVERHSRLSVTAIKSFGGSGGPPARFSVGGLSESASSSSSTVMGAAPVAHAPTTAVTVGGEIATHSAMDTSIDAPAQVDCKGELDEDKVVVNWKAVQMELGRKAVDCCNKWNCLRYHKLKKGPFDDSEDVVMDKMVEECQGRSGLWGMIGKALGRPQHRCRARWLSRKRAPLPRSAEALAYDPQRHQQKLHLQQLHQLQHYSRAGEQVSGHVMPVHQQHLGMPTHHHDGHMHVPSQYIHHQHIQLQQQQLQPQQLPPPPSMAHILEVPHTVVSSSSSSSSMPSILQNSTVVGPLSVSDSTISAAAAAIDAAREESDQEIIEVALQMEAAMAAEAAEDSAVVAAAAAAAAVAAVVAGGIEQVEDTMSRVVTADGTEPVELIELLSDDVASGSVAVAVAAAAMDVEVSTATATVSCTDAVTAAAEIETADDAPAISDSTADSTATAAPVGDDAEDKRRQRIGLEDKLPAKKRSRR